MIFIGGISQGNKILRYGRSIACACCGQMGVGQVVMTYMYFSFFFIPLFKWNKRFFVPMSCCGAVYELSREAGQAILRGEESELTSADLTLVKEGARRVYYEEGGQRIHKKCMRCGFETDEAYDYCPKCGGRI